MSSGKEEYSDIFDRPHHVSTKRAPMSRLNRAAQFSPFAALTGYDDLVKESARTTDKRIELCDDDLALLNEQLAYLQHYINEQPKVTIIYFEPDELKDGGTYREYTGEIHKINEIEKVIVCKGGKVILLDDIISITGDFFRHCKQDSEKTVD